MVTAASVRRVALTGGIAGTTALGAWYGASLKTEQEAKQIRREIVEATPEDHIARLEATKKKLLTRRMDLERKILDLETRKAGDA